MVNPFPLARERRGGRAGAHHNPMEPFGDERVGLYRPRVARRIPRAIPDELFNRLFAERALRDVAGGTDDDDRGAAPRGDHPRG